MKKLLWLAIVAGFAISCDDDETTPSVEGSWTFYNSKTTDCTDAGDNDVEEDDNGCDDGDCSVFTFTNDGTFTYVSKYQGDIHTDAGTYQQDGTTINITCTGCDLYENKEAVWVVSETELTISGKLSLPGCKFIDRFKKL